MVNYLSGVQNCPVPDFVHNNRNNLDIKFSSNDFNPYITVADDVSSLGFLTLLVRPLSLHSIHSQDDIRIKDLTKTINIK